ncbi:YceH family protein [Stieleria sp. TO1_6]|uniref:YceH family protein n=1 Tax=Stieleria tagensis TaxID=2956795 RepID=UPI00209A9807|nr:YceH family protein [Stieleria tagensis]MCO8124906.1 YceH family protein [Stieleria tagensis]
MSNPEGEAEKRCLSLSSNARRVLGVLVEKAKTTPDNYPLTASALISGCNQKSNRSPQMNLDENDVLLALDELRDLGAAREIQGNGRVTKFRHAAYDWLELDSPQAAVITELLLRGPQTIGELRTRASRMYNMPDLDAVKSVLDSLVAKDLVESLSPPGRGQTFAHKLYPPQERQYLEAKIEKQAAVKSANVSETKKDAVDQLIARLDAVNQRIDDLEARLKQLES